jgi:signal transduction histidine kinase
MKIADELSGTLTLASEPGKGSRFTATFPRHHA